MSGAYPPVEYRDIIRLLKHLGFTQRPNKATSHEQWIREGPPFRKVTVDRPKSPFGPKLVAYMANQMGLSKRELYNKLREIC
jgi:predicted RNA binding protein YcfA (HicA-like mRNA interferase family)